MPLFQTNIDLNKNELRNAKLQNLASDPGSPTLGQFYYNTGSNQFMLYTGSAFVALSAGTDATTGAKGIVQLAGDLGGSGTAAAAPIISAGAITATKVSDTLKPSVSAAAGTESLRALGSTSSTALAGNTALNAITAPTADVSLNTHKITNLVDPVSAQDAATKLYVDNAITGLDAKASVRAATTANGTLATAYANGQAIDGITLATGDRILLKDQSTQAENGIYIVAASGAPARATDMDAWSEVPNAYVWVEVGTANADSGWVVTADQGGTIGSTAMTWVQFNGLGQITAGNGLTKTGNTIDVVGTASRISVSANAIDIDTAYVGQSTITTLGTITTGTWTGTTIAVANGGTGQTTAKAARETGLGGAGYYSSATHSAGTTITITQATHLLRSSRGLIVQVQDETTGAIEIADTTVGATGDVVVTFATSQTQNTKSVTIIG